MKRYNMRYLIPFILLLFVASTNYAADRYWVAATNGSWNDANNWAASSGGAGGAGIPGNADVAIFDGAGLGDATVDANANVLGIDVQSGYTGTITQNTSVMITIGLTGGIFSGGTFTGGDSEISTTGGITISGTAFTSTTGDLNMRGNFTLSSGSFSHNNGTTIYNATAVGPIISGNPTFYNFTTTKAGGGTHTINVNGGEEITVNNTLSVEGTGNYTFNGGTVNALGDVTLTSTTILGGNAIINISGTSNQTLSGTTTVTAGFLPNITINKTAGTLFISGTVGINGDVTHVAGTVDATTNTSTVSINGGANPTLTGAITFHNLAFFRSGGGTRFITVAAGATINVNNDFTTHGAGPTRVDGDPIHAFGNIDLSAGDMMDGGTGTIHITGINNQLLTGFGGTTTGELPNVEVDKTGGTFTFGSANISVSGNWTYTQGTVDATTNNSTIVILANVTSTISGSPTWDNLIFTKVGGGATVPVIVPAGQTLTIEGDFSTLTNNSASFNDGTIRVLGNINVDGSGLLDGGTGTFLIAGTGNQTFTGYTIVNVAEFPNVIIDKPSGTLTLINQINMKGDWTYLNGTVDAQTNNSTLLLFANTNPTINGNHSLHNLLLYKFGGGASEIITINPGDQLTLTGDLLGQGQAQSVSVEGGTIALQGDVDMQGQGTINGGTATIKFTGTANQNINMAGSPDGILPNLDIDKPAGDLILDTKTEVKGNIAFTRGVVQTTAINVLFLHDTYNATAASNISYVAGPMTKTGGDAFTFPIGKNGNYQPLTISAPTATADEFTAAYFDTQQTQGSALGTGINSISTCEHWNLTNTGTSAVNITLGWNANSCDKPTDLLQVKVTRWDGAQWVDEGNTGTTGDETAGTVISNAISTTGFFTLGNVTPPSLECFVTWHDIEGMSYDPGTNTLTKTAPQNTWSSATARSTHYLPENTDGFLKYIIESTTGRRAMGLATYNEVTDQTRRHYRIIFNQGQLRIVEFGANIGNFGPIVVGDEVSIHREGNQIIYRKNGIDLRTVTTNPTTEYFAFVAIRTPGISMSSLQADFCEDKPITTCFAEWTDLIGINYDAATNTITKTAPQNTWSSARARSQQYLPSNTDGFLRYEVEAINNRKFLGFSTSNNNITFGNVEYGVYFNRARIVIIESGTNLGLFGFMLPGDVISIQREGNQVIYRRNNTVLRTVTVDPSLTLFSHASIRTPGASLSNVTVNFGCGTKNQHPFAHLTKRLDAGYYTTINGRLYFRYDEDYNAENFRYNVYDQTQTVLVSEQDQQLISIYGDNRMELNFTDTGTCLPDDYYILEVINDKDEKWYLRFRQENVTCQ